MERKITDRERKEAEEMEVMHEMRLYIGVTDIVTISLNYFIAACSLIFSVNIYL